MKNKNLKSLFLTGTVCLVILSSCHKKIDDAYINPNAAIRQPIEQIMPGVIGGLTWFSSSAGTAYGVITDGTFVGRYIQYFGINSSGDTWGQMSMLGGAVDNGGSMWATVYYGHGQNVNRIIQWGTEEQKWDYVGAALAIRAWDWLELTQEYNEGICSEAWVENKSSFNYDPQPQILDSCRAVALRALEYLNRTDGNVSQANLAKGDFYFNNGDVNKWKKFAYGVLARSYGLLSIKNNFVSEHYADSAIKYASLAATTNADNNYVTVSGLQASNYMNYWGPFRANFGTYRQGEYIARLMNGDDTTCFAGLTDPRAWYILSENANGTFKGLRPWAGNATNTPDYPKNFWRYVPAGGNATSTATPPASADSSRYVYQNTSPWPMMTASEMQFILAEAALKKGDKALALQAYTNAISLHFDLLTTVYPQNIPAGKAITPAVKNAYMTDPRVMPATPNGLTLTHIMNQKYIALYIWGTLETWVDMRKYNYIDLDPATSKKVYAGFTPPSGSNLISTNNGKLTYRMRPRFNSEYLYDVPALTAIGAYQYADYNTFKTWFAIP